VGSPHRNLTNTPTRCDAMVAEPSRDWSVFKQIFADHWDAFQHAHPCYQTSYYDGLVAKMLGCGNPEKMGYIEYRCLHCREATHRVTMSCKSSLCLRCALPVSEPGDVSREICGESAHRKQPRCPYVNSSRP